MTRITVDFSIAGPVDFVDVHVERDNRLFIDPSAIRAAAASGNVYGQMAATALNNFFDETLIKLRSTNRATLRQGEADLQQFSEISYTRLGLSKSGTNGHGAAEDLGTRIWTELRTNPLCHRAIATLKYVEDIPLFVEGIDRDITSDITARIILETLEKFTLDMTRKYPSLATRRRSVTEEVSYWDQPSLAWRRKRITVPQADAKALLLVPKAFVNYKIQMSFGQYYQVPLLDYLQSEDMIVVQRRKQAVLRPRFSKKTLRTFSSSLPTRTTNRKQTERIFKKDGTDVLGGYRSKQQSAFVPLTDAQLDERIERI